MVPIPAVLSASPLSPVLLFTAPLLHLPYPGLSVFYPTLAPVRSIFICFPGFYVWMKLLSRVQLFATPWAVAYHAPPSMGFPRQEYWSRVPFSSPGGLRDPGIEPGSPALQADALPSEPPRKPRFVWVSWISSVSSLDSLSLNFIFWGLPGLKSVNGSVAERGGGRPASFYKAASGARQPHPSRF